MDNDIEVQDQSLKIGESLRLKLNTDDADEESDNRAKVHAAGDHHKYVEFPPPSSEGQHNQAASSGLFCLNVPFTLEWFKAWSISSYNSTKRKFDESLFVVKSRGSVEVELEGTVETLLDMQHRYNNVIKLLVHNSNVLYKLVESQALLQRNIVPVSHDCNENEIKIDFVLPTLVEVYSSILNFICQQLTTLCDVTFRDTVDSVHLYSEVRSEYDGRLLVNHSQPQNSLELQIMKSKCEQLRESIETKMKLLQENKVKVMRKCLSLLAESNFAFYSGQYANLCEIRQRYNVPVYSAIGQS